MRRKQRDELAAADVRDVHQRRNREDRDEAEDREAERLAGDDETVLRHGRAHERGGGKREPLGHADAQRESRDERCEPVRFFEEQLRQGSDLLHIALGSGMTTSVDNAMTAAELVRERFPDRKVVVIDSICSSSGYGMLVDYAADMRDAGRTMDEVAGWVEANRHDVHHQFYSTELRYYQRSGRMSGPAAAIATVLNICPIMRLDDRGRIIAYEKVRGKKRALMDISLYDAKTTAGGSTSTSAAKGSSSNTPKTGDNVLAAMISALVLLAAASGGAIGFSWRRLRSKG